MFLPYIHRSNGPKRRPTPEIDAALGRDAAEGRLAVSEGQQVVLVTGASSGIGAATAALLAERGYRVFGTSRRPRPTRRARGVEMLELDVRSDASVEACVDALLARAGRIDILVNNAGFALFGESEGVSIVQAKEQFETNVSGRSG